MFPIIQSVKSAPQLPSSPVVSSLPPSSLHCRLHSHEIPRQSIRKKKDC